MTTTDSAGTAPDANPEERRAKRQARIDVIANDVVGMRNALCARFPSWRDDMHGPFVTAGMIALASADAADVLDDIDNRLHGIQRTLDSIEQSGVGGR